MNRSIVPAGVTIPAPLRTNTAAGSDITLIAQSIGEAVQKVFFGTLSGIGLAFRILTRNRPSVSTNVTWKLRAASPGL